MLSDLENKKRTMCGRSDDDSLAEMSRLEKRIAVLRVVCKCVERLKEKIQETRQNRKKIVSDMEFVRAARIGREAIGDIGATSDSD